MKKIWAMRKNEEGVSPVIATILMVAITVVLAAVLYVMVLGIGGPGSVTPTIAMTRSTTATQWVYTVTAISGATAIQQSDVFVQLKGNGTSTFLIQTVLLSTATGSHGFVYSAASAGTTISVGDVFTLLKSPSGYTTGTVLTLVTTGAGGQYGTWTI
jgi:flagellin-like protein